MKLLLFFLRSNICTAPSFISKDTRYVYEIGNITSYSNVNFKENQTIFYLLNTISISNCNFSNNTAFGRHIESRDGGAILVLNSCLTIINGKFEACMADYGGAISSQSSDTFMSGVTFKNNKAFKFGGAVMDYSSKGFELDIINCTFDGNVANYYGGGISCSNIRDIDIHQSKFYNNIAGMSGGGLHIWCCQSIYLYSTEFRNNKVEQDKLVVKSNNNNSMAKFYNDKNITSRFQPKGGGAIFISSKATFDEVYTWVDAYQLCFQGNKASSFSTNNPRGDSQLINGTGNTIMLKGTVCFRMRFSNVPDKIFNNRNEFTIDSQASIENAHSHEPSTCPKMESDGLPYPTIYNYPQIKNKNNESITSYVPSPTGYTYYATRITKDYQYPDKNLMITAQKNYTHVPFINETHSSKISAPAAPNGSSYSYTLTITLVEIESGVYTLSKTLTYKNETLTVTFIRYYYTFRTLIETITETLILIRFQEDIPSSKTPVSKIILISTLVLASALILAMIGLFLYRKNREAKEDDDDDESVNDTYNDNYETRTEAILELSEGDSIDNEDPNFAEDQRYLENDF